MKRDISNVVFIVKHQVSIPYEILYSEFLISKDGEDEKFYGYEDSEQMVGDFIKYYNYDIYQDWWCDKIIKRIINAAIVVDRYLIPNKRYKGYEKNRK